MYRYGTFAGKRHVRGEPAVRTFFVRGEEGGGGGGGGGGFRAAGAVGGA